MKKNLSNLVFCLIPARAGSKGIPKKNLADLNGKPLIAHTIELALSCEKISKVFVSTDCNEIASTSRKYGALCPFLRPKEAAQDWSRDIDVFRNFVNNIERYDDKPDYIVHLRCTTPFRRKELIDKAVNDFVSSQKHSSLRSFCLSYKTPYKMWIRLGKDEMRPLLGGDLYGDKEYFNLGRQDLPVTFEQDPYIDIYRTSIIESGIGLSGDNIMALILENRSIDIDSLDDLEHARYKIQK